MRPSIVPVASILMAAAVSAEEPRWRAALAAQAMAEEGCEPTYYTNESVRSEDGGTAIEVRVHCADGRAFDAERKPGDARFILRPCASTDAC